MSLTDGLRRGYTPGVAPEVSVPELTLPQMVEEVACRYPQRAALDFFFRPTTHAQLVDRARRAASVLARAGVASGDRVALMMPNCPQYVIAVLATMTLGGTVVEHNPLPPVFGIEKEFEVHDVRAVTAWKRSIDKLAFLKDEAAVFSVDLICVTPGAIQLLLCLPVKAAKEKRMALSVKSPTWIRSWDHEVMRSPRWSNECPVSPDDLVLLIYTGGTTGIPKGAALTHRDIPANIAQLIAWVPVLHEGAEVLYYVLSSFHAFGFTIGLFAGLRLGVSVALFPKFDTTMILTS